MRERERELIKKECSAHKDGEKCPMDPTRAHATDVREGVDKSQRDPGCDKYQAHQIFLPMIRGRHGFKMDPFGGVSISIETVGWVSNLGLRQLKGDSVFEAGKLITSEPCSYKHKPHHRVLACDDSPHLNISVYECLYRMYNVK